MRKIITCVLILLTGLTMWGQNGGTSIDGIVAVVGKSIIMRSDLEKHFIDYKAQFKTVEDPDEVYCSILENLVFNKLMVNQAELDSIEISDEEVDYRLNTRIQYFLQQIRLYSFCTRLPVF